MPAIPDIFAPNGAYRERGFVPARTALLNIDMQNGEFNADILASARTPGSMHADKRAFYEQREMGLKAAYDHASAVMVENMLARDAEEGIGAFMEKRAPVWEE